MRELSEVGGAKEKFVFILRVEVHIDQLCSLYVCM